MKLNEEILRLRADGSSPEAKGRVVERLQEKRRKATMKMIGKLSIPAALVAAVAVGGMLSVPRTALASPATVARAIRDIKNYVINSFTLVDGKRTLTSKTTVVDGKLNREFFDNNGNPVVGKATVLDGVMLDLVIGDDHKGGKRIRAMKNGPAGAVQIVKGDKLGGPGEKTVEVKAEKGPDGKVTKKYIVDGKEVSELPADLKDKFEIKLDGNGKDVIGHHIELDSGKKSGEVVRHGMMVVEGDKNGDVTTFASGQTSADYLLKLLEDPSRWVITRGVSFNGQKLDKFTLNGPMSPIELYVDPQTSLPKVLRFVGPGERFAPQVEDEYVYGAVPPVK